MTTTTTATNTTAGLGWVGVDRAAPHLAALRARLLERNGLPGLDVLAPDETERAATLFYRDGFVVVRDVLTPAQLAFLRAGVDREVRNMLALDGNRTGNRGSHRYSFGGASRTGHMMHLPEWAMLLDIPAVTAILTAIFDSPDYLARGGGGDYCLPGAVDYQPLHSDIRDRTTFTNAAGRPVTFGSFKDPRGRMTIRDLPAPFVCCNFLTVDFTALNGPTRQIPGTQHSHEPIPTLADEPEWMRLSTVCPAPAGSVLIRDTRAWHGGTPNLTDEVRAIPNAEFLAPWFHEPLRTCMPRAIHDTLSPHAQRISRYIVAAPGQPLDTGWLDGLGGTPPGLRPGR